MPWVAHYERTMKVVVGVKFATKIASRFGKLGRLAEQNKVTYYIVVSIEENTIKSPKSNKIH